MRVIAGSHRGRRLKGPDTADTRPVTDRVKESIFSSLGPIVIDARVADVFAGVGSFGIEAISRGAQSVVFVENGRKTIDALEANLSDLGIEGRIAKVDATKWVSSVAETFDLVFCDPPWPLSTSRLGPMIEDLTPRLAPEAVVIVTRRSTDEVPQPKGFVIDDDRRHGDTRIIRYKMEHRQ